ncbi:hypothetical protein ACP70R_045859 [Stipagrostis hirtigluma subsp. patula]
MNRAQEERLRAIALQISRSPARGCHPRKLNNLVHLTIEMIHEAIERADGGYTLVINNTVVGTLKLCGKIQTRCTDEDDMTSYTITDDTGTIGGIMWPNDMTGKTAVNDMPLGSTAIVTGGMVKMDGKWQLNTYQAHAVTDENYITLHKLQMVTEQLDLMRLPLAQEPVKEHPEELEHGETEDQRLPENPESEDTSTKDKSDILIILDDPNIKMNENGASVEYVAYRLGKEETLIASLMEELVMEGLAYATGPRGYYRSLGDSQRER